MTKVVNLSIVKREREVSIEEAWQRFVDAQERAKATLALVDGIAAGKAFAAFCNMFERKAS